jgi:hypothetical protein
MAKIECRVMLVCTATLEIDPQLLALATTDSLNPAVKEMRDNARNEIRKQACEALKVPLAIADVSAGISVQTFEVWEAGASCYLINGRG